TQKHDEAVRDLEEAVALQPTAPRCFHLAQAYHASKNASAATAAWRKAKSLGLAANVLHPLERPAFERLGTGMEGKEASAACGLANVLSRKRQVRLSPVCRYCDTSSARS